MGKKIRITESQLQRVIKKNITEQSYVEDHKEYTVSFTKPQINAILDALSTSDIKNLFPVIRRQKWDNPEFSSNKDNLLKAEKYQDYRTGLQKLINLQGNIEDKYYMKGNLEIKKGSNEKPNPHFQ